MARTALALGLLLAATAAAAVTEHQPATEEEVEQRMRPLLERFADTVDRLQGYQKTLTKRQRIDGKLRPMETVQIKHRREPECRYMRWLEGPHKGREVLYCPNRYNGRMKVHESGLLGFATLTVDPNGSLARSGNLRPIQDTGLWNMLRKLREDLDSRQRPGVPQDTLGLASREVHGQPSHCVYRQYPSPVMDAYPVGAREFCFSEAGLPTEVQFWNAEGELMEHYTFRDYRLDPPFTDRDFSTDHPEYGF